MRGETVVTRELPHRELFAAAGEPGFAPPSGAPDRLRRAMSLVDPAGRRMKFGRFELDPATGELWREGTPVKLQDQPAQVLVALLDRPGEIVTREELRRRLWAADTFVDFEHGLNTAIKKLRQALGDSAENPRFVETLARRGYRFIAPVTVNGTAPGAVRGGRRRSAFAALVAVVALSAAIGSLWLWRRASTEPAHVGAPDRVELAVLPFRVLSDDPRQAFLGIGIADAITTRLANVRTLRVRPTAAAIKYDPARVDLRQVGLELETDHIVVGTLRYVDETFRVNVQLVRTEDGVPVWGRNYDVTRSKLLDLEDAVAEPIAAALQVQLTPAERARMQRVHTRNPAAYEAYLEARTLMANYTDSKMREAIERYERALTLEPDYALARAGLAIALSWFSVRYAYEADARVWARRADEEATKALARDPNLGEAHLAIASAAGTLYGGFDWQKVLAETSRALVLDPTLDLAYTTRSRAFYHLGLFDQAAAEYRLQRELNPLPGVESERLLAATELFSGQFAGARKRAEALAAQTDAPVVRTYLGLAQFYLGETDKATATLEAVRRGPSPDVRSQAALASLVAARGDAEEARRLIKAVVDGPYMDHHVAYSLGAAFAQLREPAAAITWLKRARDEGFPCYPWFTIDPLLDPVRADPGFAARIRDLEGRFARARWDAAATAQP
jgi:TolB-like protein/DNA-binding winged helix-turn-helix (wHTH) protein